MAKAQWWFGAGLGALIAAGCSGGGEPSSAESLGETRQALPGAGGAGGAGGQPGQGGAGGQPGQGGAGGAMVDAWCKDGDGIDPATRSCSQFFPNVTCAGNPAAVAFDTCLDGVNLREKFCQTPAGAACAAGACCQLANTGTIDCNDYCTSIGKKNGKCVTKKLNCGGLNSDSGACECGVLVACGDGTCDSAEGEDCIACAADCGSCQTCPDGVCSADEDCSSCPDDCGTCGAGGAGGMGSSGSGPATSTTTGAGGSGSAASSSSSGAGGGTPTSCKDVDGPEPMVRSCIDLFDGASCNTSTTQVVDVCVDGTQLLERGCGNPSPCAADTCCAQELDTLLDCNALCQQTLGVSGACVTKPSTCGALTADMAACECAPVCGDYTCETEKGESCSTCATDCGTCVYCGNGACDGGEDCSTCSTDCGVCPYCGDGSCGAGEDCASCSTDCGSCPTCGDAVCSGGEDCWSCPGDCGSCQYCGDMQCNGSEDCWSCPGDCGSCGWCGDGQCNGSESCSTCPNDCGPCTWCGDGQCNGGEDCASCSSDCGVCPFCGDGQCNGGEDCASCSSDCGVCPFCGDGQCNGGETCGTCSMDCGSCEWCGDGQCTGAETCAGCPGDCGSCVSCGDGVCSPEESCSSCSTDCGACACGGDAPPFGGTLCGGGAACAVGTNELVDTIASGSVASLTDGPSLTLDASCAVHLVHPAVGGTYAVRSGGAWSVGSTGFGLVAGSLSNGPGNQVQLVSDEGYFDGAGQWSGDAQLRLLSQGQWSAQGSAGWGCLFRDRGAATLGGTTWIECGSNVAGHGGGSWWSQSLSGSSVGFSSLAVSPSGYPHRLARDAGGSALLWSSPSASESLPVAGSDEHLLAVTAANGSNPEGQPFAFVLDAANGSIHGMARSWSGSWSDVVFEANPSSPGCPLPVPGATCSESYPATRLLRAFASASGDVRLLYAKGNFTFSRAAKCSGAGYCVWEITSQSSAGELLMAATSQSNPTSIVTTTVMSGILPAAADVEVDALGRVHVALMSYAAAPAFGTPANVGLELRYLVLGP